MRTTTAEPLFVRGSSGLVRTLGLRETFIMNFGWTGAAFSVSLAFMIAQSLWAFPGADIGLAQLITVVILVPPAVLTYAQLASVMPRSGGDYVYISRILHPALGFMASFSMAVMLIFFDAWGAYWGGAQSLSAVLATLGHTLHSGGLLSVADWAAGKTGALVIGLIVLILFGVAVAAGTRVFARVVLVLFGLGLVGTVVGLAVMAVVPHDTFVRNFNSFMTSFSKDHAYYDTVLARAHQGGASGNAFSFGATLSTLPIIAFMSIWVFASAYVGGEVRQARRTQFISPLAALAFIGITVIINYYLLRKLTGYDFLVSVNTDYFNGKLSELPILPFFNLFAMTATGNSVLAVLIGLGYLTMSLLFIPVTMMFCTRLIFAWSFDRVLPAGMAKVDSRFSSPVNAVVALILVAIAFLVIFIYTDWLTTLGAIEGILPALILGCLAGAVLPWRRRGLFGSSPIANLRVGGVPLITVTGVLGLIYAAALFVAFLFVDRYLVNSTSGLIWVGSSLAAGLAIFFVSRAVRRQQGIDLIKAYHEIPPE